MIKMVIVLEMPQVKLWCFRKHNYDKSWISSLVRLMRNDNHVGDEILRSGYPSVLLMLITRSINTIWTDFNIALIHHTLECIWGGLVLGQLLLGCSQLILKLREPGHFLLDGVLLDNDLELVVFNFLLCASTLTADFHQVISGASGFYKSKEKWLIYENKEEIDRGDGWPTWNGGTRGEGLGDPWVKLDSEVMLDCELLVPLEHPFVNPSSEGIPHDGIHNVNYILAAHFPDFSENWEADNDSRFAETVVEDTIQWERLVLGNKQVFNLVAEDGLLFTGRKVLEL